MQPNDPGPVVVIGLREIYEAVISLNGQVTTLVSQTNGAAHEIADHESRIRLLEKARWPLPALSVLIALAALVLALVRP